MLERPAAHGRADHSPEGIDAIQVGAWYYVGDPDETLPDGTAVPTLENSYTATGGSNVPPRFRITSGAPNILNVDGTINTYCEKELEIQADLSGGTPGLTAFTLPPAFREPFDLPMHGHDDMGAYVPARLFANGEYQPGTP